MHPVQVLGNKKTLECGLLLAKMRGSKLPKSDRNFGKKRNGKLYELYMWAPCEKKLKFGNFQQVGLGGDSCFFFAKTRKFRIKKKYICGALKRKNETGNFFSKSVWAVIREKKTNLELKIAGRI